MKVLYVCTANICRSASAAQLLRDAAAQAPESLGIDVQSAGTHALLDNPACSIAPALAGRSDAHRSQALTCDLVDWADVILTAAREHRSTVVELDPKARSRTFTIRQAGRIAHWLVDTGMPSAARNRAEAGDATWAERFEPGDPRREVEPMPAEPDQRTAWFLTEMDAARGMAGVVSTEAPVADEPTRWRLFGRSRAVRRRARAAGGEGAVSASPGWAADGGPTGADPRAGHADDVPDPHVLGMGLHAVAHQQIKEATEAFVRLLRAVESETEGGR